MWQRRKLMPALDLSITAKFQRESWEEVFPFSGSFRGILQAGKLATLAHWILSAVQGKKFSILGKCFRWQ
jgi:hypothetical protein